MTLGAKLKDQSGYFAFFEREGKGVSNVRRRVGVTYDGRGNEHGRMTKERKITLSLFLDHVWFIELLYKSLGF